jgi:hypothetical protein
VSVRRNKNSAAKMLKTPSADHDWRPRGSVFRITRSAKTTATRSESQRNAVGASITKGSPEL